MIALSSLIILVHLLHLLVPLITCNLLRSFIIMLREPSLTFLHRVKHLFSLTHFLSLNTNLYYHLSFLTHWLVIEFLTIVHLRTFTSICDNSPYYFKRSESIAPLSQVVASFAPISKDCCTLLDYVHKTLFWQWPSTCYSTTFQLYLLKMASLLSWVVVSYPHLW